MITDHAAVSKQILLPATFQERGAAVPFTTPVIAHARIRKIDQGEFEALVPGLSGGRGTYVLPWNNLKDMVSMSVYDRQLAKSLKAEGALSPAKIRKIALDLSKSGVSGSDRAQAAKETLEQDNAVRIRIRQVLLQAIVDRFGDQDDPIDIAAMDEQAAMVAAGRVLGGFARRQGFSGDQLIDHLIEWTRLVEPIGFPEKDCAGYMRCFAQLLRKMNRDVAGWARSEPPKSQRLANELALAAQSVVEQTEFCLASIDACRTNLKQTILDWQSTGALLRQEIERIDWLLDGWALILEKWSAADGWERHQQRALVLELNQFMPILPQGELTDVSHRFWKGVIAQQDVAEPQEKASHFNSGAG
ncbi:hypothetical protein [Aestuariispira insulae]|uniref:Uncharacterized protein n=1 Tax=Aestuariispira insulae TaxID=1461337 RepID=A0A3D9HE63_9PROT|nr:hypothetical protein [Aestuariispira insulae]RED47745.1 hypothetical protein DFP90_109109 [Aestuariispira insulae]